MSEDSARARRSLDTATFTVLFVSLSGAEASSTCTAVTRDAGIWTVIATLPDWKGSTCELGWGIKAALSLYIRSCMNRKARTVPGAVRVALWKSRLNRLPPKAQTIGVTSAVTLSGSANPYWVILPEASFLVSFMAALRTSAHVHEALGTGMPAALNMFTL